MQSKEQIAADLRLGLRRLAKAVVVVSSRHRDTRFAMAATAVSEVSMDPPSLLICVNRSASLADPMRAGADFCVNILHADQQAVAETCSGGARGEARFDVGQWREEGDAPPVLEGAQASFVCRNDKVIEYGTHLIVIGEVIDTRIDGDLDPLMYADGVYGRLATGIA